MMNGLCKKALLLPLCRGWTLAAGSPVSHDIMDPLLPVCLIFVVVVVVCLFVVFNHITLHAVPDPESACPEFSHLTRYVTAESFFTNREHKCGDIFSYRCL